MKKLTSGILCLVTILAVVCLVSTTVFAAPVKLKVSMGDPDAHFLVTTMKEVFKKQIEERSQGEIIVEVYSGGVLGSYRESIEGIQMGSIEASILNGAALTAYSPKFNAMGLPYLFSDREVLFEAYDGPVGKILFDTLPAFGMRGLVFTDNGFRSISNNRQPVKTPDDVKGLKIRTLESSVAIATWRALGANPTPISYGELYTALQQGVVDAQENPAVNMRELKLNTVQKYFSLTKHQADLDIFVISKSFFDKLSPKHQEIVTQAAVDFRDAHRRIFLEEDKKGLDEMVAEGLIVNDLTDAERKLFQDKVKPVYDEFRDAVGSDLMDLLLSYSQ